MLYKEQHCLTLIQVRRTGQQPSSEPELPTFRNIANTKGPQPKPLTQKPSRKAAVLGRKWKYITIFTEHVATHVPTLNLEGQDTVFVRPLPIDQPGMTDSPLSDPGSFPPFVWFCKENSSRNSVDMYTEYVAKSAQPIPCDQFISRGRAISSKYHSRLFALSRHQIQEELCHLHTRYLWADAPEELRPRTD
ncbi:hypothetical protein T265_05414 [Opisthorchis viverrini]|uniref:Uncharacterized protein n=1 Tax=Opisthorchis viverrini TaxID=6198 RepID=A0A074ZKP0_OPIVI|nr:hypothetical protein T265_05414 [Opisthorchis viverrini]KER27601.1 hypothetical protein T265_05414 [Opisthorchis viverrini]